MNDEEEMQTEEDSVLEEFDFDQHLSDDKPALPESWDAAIYRYQVEPDIPTEQLRSLNTYRPFFGRHSALGNTKRIDNLHYIDAYDIATVLDRCPTLRHRGTELKGRVLTELQLCRSNPEVGGFERRMQSTSIARQSVDQTQTITDNRFDGQRTRTKRFRLFGRRG